MKAYKFEWDKEKNLQNKLKHDIYFEEAEQAFDDPHRIITEDNEHSKTEQRYFCFGKVNKNILTVRFTFRKKSIRILGAGYWRKGKKLYEQNHKK